MTENVQQEDYLAEMRPGFDFINLSPRFGCAERTIYGENYVQTAMVWLSYWMRPGCIAVISH